ncbi:SCP-like protein [Ancylostoma ceylanicum]|uniref:SCP-like protein n=1 Tax=Ancylostoma ceylanicum TaxID=53326 RepID=A0A0D6LYD7_9BILA|nr:SCP-like protein [Ancylostoma ceylanicum]
MGINARIPTLTSSLLVVVVALLNGADMTDFGCENSLITDEWREMILNFHNDKREIVAMGKQTDKSNKALPEAQQMFRMVWDCNVEMIAHEALTNCTAIPDTGLEVNGEGLDFREGIIPKKKDFNVLTETKQLLNAWYNEVRQSIIPDTLKWGPSYHNFSAIVRDDAKGMACTYTTACGDGMKMVCVYNAPRLLATGWAKNKQTVYAPIAAKMKFVTYDEQALGKEANNKSSDCRADIGSPSNGKAMNIEEIGDYNMPLQDALELAITKWWRQVETEGIPADLKYTDAMEGAGKITKFVNMANENIERVGCAVTRCLPIGKIRVVCEYDMAPGVDEVVYTKATKKPCSGCTQIKKTCGTHYSEGLCV